MHYVFGKLGFNTFFSTYSLKDCPQSQTCMSCSSCGKSIRPSDVDVDGILLGSGSDGALIAEDGSPITTQGGEEIIIE